jgi:hypothetical protein
MAPSKQPGPQEWSESPESQGTSRSIWDLPAWFEPRDGRPALGYHEDPSRWTRTNDRVRLQSVARGQEFVLDTAKYSEAIPWLGTILRGEAG